MLFSEFKYLVKSDLYRYDGVCTINNFLRNIRLMPGFRYSFVLRLCAYAHKKRVYRYTLSPFLDYLYRHYTIKYGISISPDTRIASGLYIGHFGGIVVNTDTVIGRNCNISHDVTIGQVNRGAMKGSPTIGDNVYIAPGVKIIGKITIGNNVAIGANSVVTKDIPDNAVVVGIPGRVISYEGTTGYINRTDYEGC